MRLMTQSRHVGKPLRGLLAAAKRTEVERRSDPANAGFLCLVAISAGSTETEESSQPAPRHPIADALSLLCKDGVAAPGVKIKPTTD
jgi:hypothetical protein